MKIYMTVDQYLESIYMYVVLQSYINIWNFFIKCFGIYREADNFRTIAGVVDRTQQNGEEQIIYISEVTVVGSVVSFTKKTTTRVTSDKVCILLLKAIIRIDIGLLNKNIFILGQSSILLI